MRSRYAAYAMGLVDYIKDTTHPKSPHREDNDDAWTEKIGLFSQRTTFVSLSIVNDHISEEVAHVRFRAGLNQGGSDASFEENSRFERVNQRWAYVTGE